MKVRQLMHKGLDSVGPRCTVEQAARAMRECNIGALAVCENGVLAGVVTDRDIVVRAVAAGRDLAATTVSEIMTTSPACCYQEADIRAVARKMEARKIRRMPVVDMEEKLVGMLSIDDFTRRGQARDLLGEILESASARHA